MSNFDWVQHFLYHLAPTGVAGFVLDSDNAVAESFFGTIKTELVHRNRYAARTQARASIFEWIECWYNRRRRHSSLGYVSPEAFEARLN